MNEEDRKAILRVPGAPAEEWAARINACWQASVTGILQVGRLLTEAKAHLDHGDFGDMIERQLPFGERTAQMLMAIGKDPRLTNPKHVSLLPASWGTLYELTKLSDEEFDAGVEKKIIRADMERKDAPKAHLAGRAQAKGDLDYSPTPPWATRALMEHVFPHLGVDINVKDLSAWEPACGEGHIAEVLREYFGEVYATDIADRGYQDALLDFLDHPGIHYQANWIITNPPFEDRVLRFMLRALDLAQGGVAMFVQLRYLEGVDRYQQLFSVNPPTLIAPFVERVPLVMGRYDPNASTTTAFMWLVWLKGRTPQAPFWIPNGCRNGLCLEDDDARFTTHPVTRRAPAKSEAA